MVSMGDDFTLPVDRNGLVVYFGVDGRRFLFNGNNGFFSDNLPEWAHQVFATMDLPGEELEPNRKYLIKRFGPDCRSLLNEIAQIKEGSHPHLKPEPRQQQFNCGMIPSEITVLVSQSCNLACRYCVNQGGTLGGSRSFMSAGCAQKVADFIEGITETETYGILTVRLSGGEPLLNPEAVGILSRSLQNLNHGGHGSRIRLILGTNGTIYNREIFGIFAERPEYASVAVSLDAFKDVHDRNRPFAGSKRSSYDRTRSTLNRMAHEGIPYFVSCVVTDPSDYIKAALELHRMGVPCLSLNQLSHHVFGMPESPAVFDSDFENWKRSYLEYSKFHLDYLSRPNPVEHVDRNMLVTDYAQKLQGPDAAGSTLACEAGDGSVTIDAKGRIFPCMGFMGNERFCLGDVENGYNRVTYSEFEHWILAEGQHRIQEDRCKNCFAKRFCGGGCYAESYERRGELQPLEKAQCRYVRETVKINLYYISEMKRRNLRIQGRLTDVSM